VNDLVKRTGTGIFIVGLILAGILINQFVFMIVFAAILVTAMLEFYQIFEKTGKQPQKISGIFSGILIFSISYGNAIGHIKPHLIAAIVPVMIYIVVAEMYRKKQAPFENIGITFFGIIYVAVPISLLWYFAFRENICHYNPHLILGYFLLIWTNDTMAYLTGNIFGKNKLFERISPKKSWEGFIGGLIFCIGAAYLLSLWFEDITSWQWITIGAIVTVFGTLGDLAESMLKRSVDIKDSGNILPGHGGILDRFDALFIAVPVVYLYLQFI
jgi:phosphatidate cytidylyltransferase